MGTFRNRIKCPNRVEQERNFREKQHDRKSVCARKAAREKETQYNE